MKAKDCKMFLGDIPIAGVSSWKFDSFESEDDKEKFRKQTDEAYAKHYEIKQEKGNE